MIRIKKLVIVLKMNDKHNHINSGKRFEDESLNKIWEMSAEAEESDPVNESEVESALKNVKERAGINEESKPAFFISENLWLKSRYMIAAVALIVLGLYVFYFPKTIAVPYGEIATVELPDGSTAELNSGSTLSYNRFFLGSERNLSLNGEAYFKVTSSEKPFIVEANKSVTRVAGTEFNIRSWSTDPDRETVVTVADGKVLFYPIDQSENQIELLKGMYSRWNFEMAEPSSPEPVNITELAGWRQNRLIFRDQKLAVIFNELERRFDIRIDLEAPEVASETLTAFYTDPRNPADILNDIAMVKNLKYSETANGFRIFK